MNPMNLAHKIHSYIRHRTVIYYKLSIIEMNVTVHIILKIYLTLQGPARLHLDRVPFTIPHILSFINHSKRPLAQPPNKFVVKHQFSLR